MIILLLVLTIIAIGLCVFIAAKHDFESFGIGFLSSCVAIGGGGFAIFLLICLFSQIDGLVSGRYIDQKIDMYTEENTNIENQINELVKQYMDYESDTYSDFKGDSAITLVTLYPELKSDELVKSQIDIYTNNNQKIRELKENKIDLKSAKWWLYFGK